THANRRSLCLVTPDVAASLYRLSLHDALPIWARAYGLTLRDVEGREMVVADSADIEYRLASFLGGDILINDLIVYGADVHLYRLDRKSTRLNSSHVKISYGALRWKK